MDLPDSDVRRRQQSCVITALSKDEIKDLDIQYSNQKRISLIQILKQDKDDQSLEKYKQSILGEIGEINEELPPEVEFVLMEIIFPNNPQKNLTLDLQFGLKENQQKPFKIKEGELYNLRMHFKVNNDCVMGMKFHNIVTRHSVKVDSYSEMMGTFAPKKFVQVVDLQTQQAPSGFIMRGSYKGKAMFIDREGIVHMQFVYYFEVTKDWEL